MIGNANPKRHGERNPSSAFGRQLIKGITHDDEFFRKSVNDLGDDQHQPAEMKVMEPGCLDGPNRMMNTGLMD